MNKVRGCVVRGFACACVLVELACAQIATPDHRATIADAIRMIDSGKGAEAVKVLDAAWRSFPFQGNTGFGSYGGKAAEKAEQAIAIWLATLRACVECGDVASAEDCLTRGARDLSDSGRYSLIPDAHPILIEALLPWATVSEMRGDGSLAACALAFRALVSEKAFSVSARDAAQASNMDFVQFLLRYDLADVAQSWLENAARRGMVVPLADQDGPSTRPTTTRGVSGSMPAAVGGRSRNGEFARGVMKSRRLLCAGRFDEACATLSNLYDGATADEIGVLSPIVAELVLRDPNRIAKDDFPKNYLQQGLRRFAGAAHGAGVKAMLYAAFAAQCDVAGDKSAVAWAVDAAMTVLYPKDRARPLIIVDQSLCRALAVLDRLASKQGLSDATTLAALHGQARAQLVFLSRDIRAVTLAMLKAKAWEWESVTNLAHHCVTDFSRGLNIRAKAPAERQSSAFFSQDPDEAMRSFRTQMAGTAGGVLGNPYWAIY